MEKSSEKPDFELLVGALYELHTGALFKVIGVAKDWRNPAVDLVIVKSLGDNNAYCLELDVFFSKIISSDGKEVQFFKRSEIRPDTQPKKFKSRWSVESETGDKRDLV